MRACPRPTPGPTLPSPSRAETSSARSTSARPSSCSWPTPPSGPRTSRPGTSSAWGGRCGGAPERRGPPARGRHLGHARPPPPGGARRPARLRPRARHNRAMTLHRPWPLTAVTSVLVASFTALAAAATAGPAGPSVDSVLQALARVRTPREAALSPDGTRVAWVERMHAPDGGDERSAIHVARADGSAERTLSAARDGRPHREREARWSPDGRQIAFLSDAAQDGQMQLYVAGADGERARALTQARGQLDDPRWSPDGRRLAVLYVAGSTQEQGALVAYKPDAGVVEEKVEEARIAVVDAAGGPLREVSPADLYVYDYDWSPDGSSLAAEAARGSGTNNYWIAELFVVDATSGQTQSIWKPPLQIANPRWSPDGTSIVLIHGLMSDEGSTGGDVWLVPAAGGAPRNLTPGLAASPSWLAWRPGGEIVFMAHADGDTMIGSVAP